MVPLANKLKILGRTDLGGDELLSFQGEMSQKAVGENGKKKLYKPFITAFLRKSWRSCGIRKHNCVPGLKCLGKVKFCKTFRFSSIVQESLRSLRYCSFLFTTNHLIDSSQKFSEKCSYNPNNRMPYHVIAHEFYHISKQIRGIRQVRPSDSFESEHCSTAFQGEYLPIWSSRLKQ